MNRVILKKSLVESQGLLLACAAAMYAFCWIRVWTVSLLDMSQLATIVDQFREYERFSPVPFDQLLTYAGRVAVVYDEPVVVVSVSVWAIARGSDIVSGEVGRGTMEMLLAQPVSRLQILLSHASVTVLGAALLATVSWLGIYTGVRTTTVTETEGPRPIMVPWLGWEIPNPLGEPQEREIPLWEKVDSEVFIPAATNLFCLGFFLAGLSTLMSSWDQNRGRTIGIVMGIYIFQLIIKILGMAHDDLAWLKGLSFLTAYDPESFVSVALNEPAATWALVVRDAEQQIIALGPLGYHGLLVILGLVFYLLAAVIFCRRDLPAPL